LRAPVSGRKPLTRLVGPPAPATYNSRMNAASDSPLTRSVEDYLKVIYRLSLSGQPASTSAIAQALELAPPSVSGMVRRLSEQGLLTHEPYRGVELTTAGRRADIRTALP